MFLATILYLRLADQALPSENTAALPTNNMYFVQLPIIHELFDYTLKRPTCSYFTIHNTGRTKTVISPYVLSSVF